jgi:hypothetical protein
MNRLLICMCAVFFVLSTVNAKEAQKTAADFAAQFQTLENETQARISTIEQQMAEADAAAKENLNRQIEQIKFDYEIQRLEILLEQAESQADEGRAAEIRQALDRRLNSSAPANIVKVDRPAPSAPGMMPESRSNNR